MKRIGLKATVEPDDSFDPSADKDAFMRGLMRSNLSFSDWLESYKSLSSVN